MHVNGALLSFQLLFISGKDSQAYIEVDWKTVVIFFFFPFSYIWSKQNVCFAGDLMSEDEVLEWLRKNRFRQPELNIFMYALIALSIAFIMYTAFLLQCFKPAPPAPTSHPKQAWGCKDFAFIIDCDLLAPMGLDKMQTLRCVPFNNLVTV